MELPDELAGRTPEQVLAFLRTAPDDEVRDTVHRIGTPVVLDLLFTGMAGRFGPKAGRRPDRLAVELDDDGTPYVRVLALDERGATVVPAGPRARATLRTSLVDFLRVAAGAADPVRMLLTRRLRITGDALWVATTLRGLSAPPRQ